ncbi:9739_t:CDS:1, partial [Gigaspora margarita]
PETSSQFILKRESSSSSSMSLESISDSNIPNKATTGRQNQLLIWDFFYQE